jgi:HSP20 family protein
MTLVRYEPWNFITRLHRELEHRDLDQLAGTANPGVVALVPRVDVHDEPLRYVLQADLPGVLPADIEVTTDDGVLTLRAERRAAAAPAVAPGVVQEAAEKAATRTERSHGVYQRRFTLPDDANFDAIEAKSANGVLELVIPKQAKAQPRRVTVAAA